MMRKEQKKKKKKKKKKKTLKEPNLTRNIDNELGLSSKTTWYN